MARRQDLDETDMEILELLVEDGRTAYSDIADEVELSPPAVSSRVDRLMEHGVVRGFTVDVDRSRLRSTTPVFVELEAEAGEEEQVYMDAVDLEGAEHVFRTFDGRVLAYADAPEDDVGGWLADGVEMEYVDGYDLTPVEEFSWNPGLSASDFALDCVVCGNTVGDDGVTSEFDGETKAFCCTSCQARYEEEYRERTRGTS